MLNKVPDWSSDGKFYNRVAFLAGVRTGFSSKLCLWVGPSRPLWWGWCRWRGVEWGQPAGLGPPYLGPGFIELVLQL